MSKIQLVQQITVSSWAYYCVLHIWSSNLLCPHLILIWYLFNFSLSIMLQSYHVLSVALYYTCTIIWYPPPIKLITTMQLKYCCKRQTTPIRLCSPLLYLLYKETNVIFVLFSYIFSSKCQYIEWKESSERSASVLFSCPESIMWVTSLTWGSFVWRHF